MNIYIADSQPIVREGIKRILSGQIWIALVAEADSIERAMHLLENETTRSVLLLDLALAGGSGLNLLKSIKAKYPQLAILILGNYPEEHYAMRVIKSGANGYLSKMTPIDQLLIAIQKVSQGNRYISPAMAETIANWTAPFSDKALHETLSDREFEIMCLMATGKSSAQIARELFLSISTVSTHRNRILKKMNMHTNAQLISYAINHSLV